MEEGLNEKDIGDVLARLNVIDLDGKKEIGRLAVVKTYEETPNDIQIIEYPMELDSKIYVMKFEGLKKRGNRLEFENVGDWCYEGKVSKDEREELNRIASYPKNFLE